MPKPNIYHSIETIIKKCGGKEAVAKELGISRHLIRKWPNKGIQWWHWPALMKLSGGRIRAADFLAANCAAIGVKLKQE